MSPELDVLADVSARLESLGVPFMLTGSFALAFYATPRMTRDFDIVVSIDASHVDRITEAFGDAHYIDADMVCAALVSATLFNVMHYATGLRIDLIVRKSTPYRVHEFARRREVRLGTVRTWIVSAEDLALSKLVWARDSGSDTQLRDVQQLLRGPVDVDYLRRWAKDLDVVTRLESLLT